MNELVEDPRCLHSRLRIVTVCPCSTWPIAGQLNPDIDADTSGDWRARPFGSPAVRHTRRPTHTGEEYFSQTSCRNLQTVRTTWTANCSLILHSALSIRPLRSARHARWQSSSVPPDRPVRQSDRHMCPTVAGWDRTRWNDRCLRFHVEDTDDSESSHATHRHPPPHGYLGRHQRA